MIQLSDVPRFLGDGQEDAELWLQNFLAATTNPNDAATIRLLSTYIPRGSPARKWWDSLDADAKSSWTIFEQNFYDKWITPLSNPLDEAWITFQAHLLTGEEIFDGWALNGGGGGVSVAQDRITGWVDDHIQIGRATGRDNAALLQASNNLIPLFLRAHIQISVTPQPKTIDDLCSTLKNLPSTVLELEQVRRDDGHDNWRTVIEQRLHMVIGISERIEKALAEVSNKVNGFTLPDTQLGDMTSSPLQASLPRGLNESHSSSSENITWEPCSPLTTASLLSGTSSEVTTPVAASQALPLVVQSREDPSPSEISIENLAPEDDSLCVPVMWRKASTVLTKNERVAIASRSREFINLYPFTTKYHDNTCDGNVFTSHQLESYITTLALQDRLTRGAINKGIALDFLLSPRINSAGNNALDSYDPINAKLYHSFRGIAMIHGYRAYEHPDLVQRSISLWTKLSQYISNTRNADPDIARLRRCPLGSINAAKGVLPYDKISSAETAANMTHSAYLAECTGEVKYMEAAISSANFIESFVIDDATMLTKDCTFKQNTLEATDGTLSCHLTGIVIEGFAVLASVTGDTSWMKLMIKIATAAMHASEWHDINGILTVGSEGEASKIDDAKALKGILMRGLLEAYERNPDNIPFRNLVRSYVNVQYNALLDLARYGNSYGVDWRGPYKGPYAHGQMAALDTLVAAIRVNDC